MCVPWPLFLLIYFYQGSQDWFVLWNLWCVFCFATPQLGAEKLGNPNVIKQNLLCININLLVFVCVSISSIYLSKKTKWFIVAWWNIEPDLLWTHMNIIYIWSKDKPQGFCYFFPVVYRIAFALKHFKELKL